jgi:hypothetical protein
MPKELDMIHALIIATSVLIATAAVQNVQSAGRPLVALRELTVPQQRLPAGCAVSRSDTVRLDGNQVQGGLWAGLPIDTNPWIGTDRHVIATIRERMDGPVLTPDGPPLTARQLSQYRLQLADGVEEAYAAVYRQSDPAQELIAVYGLKLSRAEGALERSSPSRASENPRVIRLAIGPVLVVLHGDGGQCFQAVGAHLKSLAQ